MKHLLRTAGSTLKCNKKEKKGHVEITKFLINKGADVKAKDNEGKTLKGHAKDGGGWEIREFLKRKLKK